LIVAVVAFGAPAFADGSIDAKLQCQVEYGSQSEMGAACKEGVDIAERAAAKSEDAESQCTASRENGARVTRCQQGVALYARFAGQVRSTDKSSFSYTWRQPKTGFQVDVGDYRRASATRRRRGLHARVRRQRRAAELHVGHHGAAAGAAAGRRPRPEVRPPVFAAHAAERRVVAHRLLRRSTRRSC
jgi:hypothetical protein